MQSRSTIMAPGLAACVLPLLWVFLRSATAQCSVDFVPSMSGPLAPQTWAVATGDLNGDGRPDVAVASRTNLVSVMLSNIDGSLRPPLSLTDVALPTSVAIADFNGDGRNDLAVGDADGRVTIYLGTAGGTLQLSGSYPCGSVEGMCTADFNHDGRADLVVANGYDDSVSILLSTANGTFMAAVPIIMGTQVFCVAAADFNGDGRPDLVTADYFAAKVSVMLGQPGGTFQWPVDYNVGTGPYSLTVADLNSDGHPDIAAANGLASSIAILVGNGDGTFHAGQTLPVDDSPWSIATGDFNADGVTDLATTSNPNAFDVLLGNADGTFQARTRCTAGVLPRAIAVADFNGDGRTDVVVANQGFNGAAGTLSLFISGTPLAPMILAQPHSGIVCITASRTLSVTTSPSATLSYQWQWRPDPASPDWVNVANGVNSAGGHAEFSASGAQSGSFVRTGLSSSTALTFAARCIITNPCGTVTSDPATLFINSPDFNGDGDRATTEDIEAFFECLSGHCCAECGSVDFNGDGDLGTDADITAFFRVLGGGPC